MSMCRPRPMSMCRPRPRGRESHQPLAFALLAISSDKL
jgi:hypothetical protein